MQYACMRRVCPMTCEHAPLGGPGWRHRHLPLLCGDGVVPTTHTLVMYVCVCCTGLGIVAVGHARVCVTKNVWCVKKKKKTTVHRGPPSTRRPPSTAVHRSPPVDGGPNTPLEGRHGQRRGQRDGRQLFLGFRGQAWVRWDERDVCMRMAHSFWACGVHRVTYGARGSEERTTV